MTRQRTIKDLNSLGSSSKKTLSSKVPPPHSNTADDEVFDFVKDFLSGVKGYRLTESKRIDQANGRGAVIPNPADSVIEMNCEGVIIQVNVAAEQMLRRDSDQVIGSNFVELFEARQRGEIWRLVSALTPLKQLSSSYGLIRGDGQIVSVGINWMHGSGSEDGPRTAILTAQPVLEPVRSVDIVANRLQVKSEISSGMNRSALGQLREIDNAGQKLRELFKESRAHLDSSERKGLLVSGGEDEAESEATVAGDIGLDLIRIQEEANELIEDILSSTQFLHRVSESLVNCCLDSESSGTFDLNQILESVIQASELSWNDNALVKTEFSSNLPKINGFPGAIRQSFLNLLLNSIDSIRDAEVSDHHSSCNGEKGGCVRLTTEPVKDGVRVRVWDNGIVRQPIREILGGAAHRDDTGVGEYHSRWSACRELVCGRHGGQMEINRRDEGTEVSIRLPITPPNWHEPDYATRR